MARARSSVAAKVNVGKSSKARCGVPAPSSIPAGSSGGDRSSRSSSGGNPVCPRETPKWQKPITTFLVQSQPTSTSDEEETAQDGSSKSKPKRNVIHSDDEETQTNEQADNHTDTPINKELDETIELGPLTGENSHKIDEYYTTKNKGKGQKSKKDKTDIANSSNGKEDLNKENVDKENTETKSMDTDNIDKQDLNGINKDKDKGYKNDSDHEKIDKKNITNRNIGKEDMDTKCMDKVNVNEQDIENVNGINKAKEKIYKNYSNKEKIDNNANINCNVTRNKRHLDELHQEDERDSKKIKVD